MQASSPSFSPALPLAALLLLLHPMLVGWFDPPGDRAAEGNTLYADRKYAEAADKYGEGLIDAPASPLLQFNLGDAQYKQGKYSEAANAFTKTATEGTAEWTARAAYNLGNTYYRLGANAEASDPKAAIASYEQALAAYKRSMGADPTAADPKFNHELVAQKLADLKKKLEEQQKQQQQDQQQQDQQQQDQQDKQDQQQAEQKEQGDQQQPDEQQKQQAEQQQQEQQQQGSQDQQAQQQQQQEAASQGEQKPAEQAQAQAAGGEAGEQNQDRKAAQAVLDTARSEELGPDDMVHPAGIAGVGEPAEDW